MSRDRSRTAPLLVVVDDAESSSAPTAWSIAAFAASVDHAPVMLLVIADSAGCSAAVEELSRLDQDGSQTLRLGVMADEALARLVTADGVDAGDSAAVVAAARGLPGLARREAAACAERRASDRLAADSACSIGATEVAAGARASVFDDVLDLVEARGMARRTGVVDVGRPPAVPFARRLRGRGRRLVRRAGAARGLHCGASARSPSGRRGRRLGQRQVVARAGRPRALGAERTPSRHGPWRTTVVVPGADPIAVLDAVAGLDEPGPQLLVVDQFEEVFAAGVAESFASRLIALSFDAILDVHVVIVLRSDQYPALAATPCPRRARRGGAGDGRCADR